MRSFCWLVVQPFLSLSLCVFFYPLPWVNAHRVDYLLYLLQFIKFFFLITELKSLRTPCSLFSLLFKFHIKQNCLLCHCDVLITHGADSIFICRYKLINPLMANDCSWDEACAQRSEFIKGCHAYTALYKSEDIFAFAHKILNQLQI